MRLDKREGRGTVRGTVESCEYEGISVKLTISVVLGAER